MKFNFAAKITIPIVIVIIVALFITGYISHRNSQEALYAALEEQGLLMSKVVAANSASALAIEHILEDVLNNAMLAQAHLLNELLLVGNITVEDIKRIAAESGIDEFWVSDQNGVTVLTNVDGGLGWVFPDDPNAQAYEFKKLIGAPGETVTQPGMFRDIDGKFFKYVGVGRKDTPGIVQVGADANKIQEIKEQIGMKRSINSLINQNFIAYAAVLDKEGEIYIAERLDEYGIKLQDNTHLAAARQEKKETASVVKYNGQEFVEVILPWDDYTFVLGLNSSDVQSLVVKKQIESRNQLIVFSTLVAVAVAVFAFGIARTMTSPLRQLTQISDRVSRGELYHRANIRGEDEIGKLAAAYNAMLEEITAILRKLAQSTREISDVFQHLTAASAQSSKGAGENAASISQIASGAKIIAANTAAAGEHVQKTSELTSAGHEDINSVIEQMDTILSLANNASEATSELNEKAATISKILDIIAGIADQTNLLALNAAIESARAGEHGRGFAVVAEEVRKLAEQSVEAAKQIKELVTDIQDGTRKTTELIAMETEEIKEGAAKVAAVGTSFNGIARAVEELAREFEQVSQAITPMSESISSVAAVAEEQSAINQEVAATVDKLDQLAKELDTVVKRFKLEQ